MVPDKHSLLQEFPQYRERIHSLKTQNAHFAKLFEAYNKIDDEVLRIEKEIETPSDAYVEQLKQRRVALKDELFAMLQ